MQRLNKKKILAIIISLGMLFNVFESSFITSEVKAKETNTREQLDVVSAPALETGPLTEHHVGNQCVNNQQMKSDNLLQSTVQDLQNHAFDLFSQPHVSLLMAGCLEQRTLSVTPSNLLQQSLAVVEVLDERLAVNQKLVETVKVGQGHPNKEIAFVSNPLIYAEAVMIEHKAIAKREILKPKKKRVAYKSAVLEILRC
jgi:hypothetical protein